MTLKDLTIQLANWSEYLTMLVAVLSLLTAKRNAYFRLLTIYLFSFSVLTLATRITADYGLDNWYIYHVMGFLEPVFVFLLYQRIGLNSRWKWALFLVLITYVAVSAKILLKKKCEMNSVGDSFGMLLILVLGFSFLWKLYQEEKVEDLGSYSYFYITTGLSLFAAGGFFCYLLIGRMTAAESPDDYFYYSWQIVTSFASVKWILIAVGILVERKTYAK